MSGPQMIYVDFSVRDPDGRFYVAQLDDFSAPPRLGDTFVGTDFDEFEVECRVVAILYDRRQVLHRPVDAAAVPGTALKSVSATVEPVTTLSVSAAPIRELLLQP